LGCGVFFSADYNIENGMPGNGWKFFDGLNKILNIDLINVAIDVFNVGESLYKHFVETGGDEMFLLAEVVEKSEHLDAQGNRVRREFERLEVLDQGLSQVAWFQVEFLLDLCLLVWAEKLWQVLVYCEDDVDASEAVLLLLD
jgi:hypothetical protein